METIKFIGPREVTIDELFELGTQLGVDYAHLRWNSIGDKINSRDKEDRLGGFGTPPQRRQRMMAAESFYAKWGGTEIATSICMAWLEQNEYKNLFSVLLRHAKYGETWFRFCSHFYRGYVNTWGELFDKQEREIIDRGIRHIDSLWRE